MVSRVLVIGGYGNFGRLAAERLVGDPNIVLVVAGRSAGKARDCAASLQAGQPLEWAEVDFRDDLDAALSRLRIDCVLHTSGPFQGQDYGVAEACIRQRCHYVDLADARAFVAGIAALNRQAAAADVLVASGASSVPALTTAVIDHFLPRFERLAAVDFGIATAQRTSRGLATTEAVLSYAGRPFVTLRAARQRAVYGWMDLRWRKLPGLGWRAFANCDVPDLELLPARYPGLVDVRFQAGLESALMQLGLWALAWGVRLRVLPNLARFAPTLLALSRLFDRFGRDDSAMYIDLRGSDAKGADVRVDWQITARGGDGLYIPCTPAVLLVKRLAAGTLAARGAMPCVGLLGLQELLAEFDGLDIECAELAGQRGER